jgi:hypothetical protein
VINATLDELIAKCKQLVDEEGLEFGEEFMSERDPSILHFLLASGGWFRGGGVYMLGAHSRGRGAVPQNAWCACMLGKGGRQ